MANALSDKERTLIDAYWRAANYLSVGQIYLYDNPLLQAAAGQGAHQAAAARPLGHHARAELPLRPPEPAHQEARPRHDLRHRPGPRRTGAGRQRLSRGNLQRGLPEHLRRRGGHEAPVQAVLVSRRHPEPRGARNARLDPRGRRARLCPLARLRRRLRQSRPDRRLRRRRRRGRDRTAGDELALQQVPEPGDATAPCCRSCTSTATRSPTPPSWPASATRSWSSSSAATATRRISSRATSPQTMHELMAATLDTVIGEIRQHQGEGAARGGRSARAGR